MVEDVDGYSEISQLPHSVHFDDGDHNRWYRAPELILNQVAWGELEGNTGLTLMLSVLGPRVV